MSVSNFKVNGFFYIYFSVDDNETYFTGEFGSRPQIIIDPQLEAFPLFESHQHATPNPRSLD